MKEFDPNNSLKEGEKIVLFDENGNVAVNVTSKGTTITLINADFCKGDDKSEEEALAWGKQWSLESQQRE